MGLDTLKSLAVGAPSTESPAAESRRMVKGLRKLLAVEPDWAEGERDQARLSAITDDLETALASVDGRLVLGLLGGTGVGKSTLISALAGEVISKASAVRPTTNKPVIYRHQSFPPLAGLAGQEALHKVEALRGLAIIDFPDIDSLESAHHRLVLDSLKLLDLVLWVTDINKYADRRLYEVMRQVRPAADATSQAVVLNKRDQLLNRPDGEAALKEVLASLGDQLATFGGWEGYPPWPISAAEGLAEAGRRAAGGLAPLRDLLDSLADAKDRRLVEMSNLKARNLSLKTALRQAARPEEWLQKLEAIKKLAGSFNPSGAIEADLAAISRFRPLYLAPKLDRIEKKITGLLSLFTDAGAFISNKFKRSEPVALPPAAPPPVAPAFVSHLSGFDEDFSFLAKRPSSLKAGDLARASEAVLEKALNDKLFFAKDPKPGSWLLLLWPTALAVILVWAESGGQFGGPAVLIAAALRSLAPWFIFSLLGDAVLTNLIWFRVRRRLERDFQKALDQARIDLMALAKDQLAQPIAQAADRQTAALDRLAEI